MSKPRPSLSGLTWSSMRKHPAIIPIFALTAGGALLAAYYVFRLATRSPEVTWNRKSNPEPWNMYADPNTQYKFISSGRDYSKGTPAPDYKSGA